MAGGYKLWSTGEVVTATNLQNYIQNQTVMVFASASARTTALSGVLAEGMISYRTDSHVLEIYNGTAWVAPETNLTTKGDLAVYSTAPDRLPVGTDGQALVANSSASTGLSWIDSVYTSGKNRFINGAMEFDQRNVGASFTPADSTYGLDRLLYGATQASKTTCQRQSSVVPNGFAYAMKVTSTSAYSILSTDEFEWMTHIEGSLISDFAWGTSSAKTVTLSFWVNSSLTGTFGGSFNNQAHNRSYAFSYTINNANTWERKTITVAGDTTGTWINDSSGYGIELLFSLGAGSTKIGTAGSWGSTFLRGVTGQVNLVANNAATWYITGIQLEVGSVATSFSRTGGTYQGELTACQYYCRKSFPIGTAPANNAGGGGAVTVGNAPKSGSFEPQLWITFPSMRVAPTVTLYNPGSGTAAQWWDGVSASSANARAFNATESSFIIDNTDVTLAWSARDATIHYLATAEL